MGDETPEQSETEKKATRLAEGNQAAEKRLGEMGFQVTGLREQQLNIFLAFLADEGVLTDEQIWNFRLQWEEFLDGQLSDMEVQARNFLEQQRQAAVRQRRENQRRLAVPISQSLLLPPGHQRPIRDNPQG